MRVQCRHVGLLPLKTSSPSSVLPSSRSFHFFITGLFCSFNSVSSHGALRLLLKAATLTSGLNEKLWHLLSPIWPVYPHSTWQWPRNHYLKSMVLLLESIPNDKLDPKYTILSSWCTDEDWGKGGCKKSKSICFSLQLWFMSLFWFFFFAGSMDEGKYYFFVCPSPNQINIQHTWMEVIIQGYCTMLWFISFQSSFL